MMVMAAGVSCVSWRGALKDRETENERERYKERQEALGHRPCSLLSDMIALLGNCSVYAQNGY